MRGESARGYGGVGNAPTRSDAFHSGVPRWVFEQLGDLRKHRVSPRFGLSEIVDYFYTLPNGRQIRTRVHYDSARMELSTEHVDNHLMQSFVASASGEPGTRVASRGSSELSSAVYAHQLRARETASRFVDRRDDGDVWRYELSRTWSGNTRDAVEYNQHNSNPRQVECELVDTQGTYMRHLSNAQVAESMHKNMLMLLGYDDVDTAVEISHVKNERGGSTSGTKRVRNQNDS